MRKLNLVFLLGLVVALLALSGAVYLVHGHQVQRNASALLDRARKDEEQGKSSKAAAALRQYLSLRPRDGEAWRWYARVRDGVTTDSRRRDRVYLIYEEALRYNPDDPTLERRCVDLALELRPERTADAKRHLKVLLTQAAEKLEKGTEVSSAAMELAELKELEGKCLLLESDFEAAANAYNEAISYDPTRLFCYVQRARLYRSELRKDPKDADDEIEWMVANNPESGPAHLYRFRYLSEFRPPAPASDLKKALELAPENREVLLTAALVAEQKKDPVAARAYLEKGLKLHPQNAEFPMALAWLELGEQHPDRAEAVLRQAYQAKPSVDLAFLLAETLILQDKIEGSDGARVFMDYLADRGHRETYVRYLEARIEVKEKRWDKAISKIESALAVLKADPRISMQLNLMLAECSTGLGWEEKRLAALRSAGEGPIGSEAARLALARSLTGSGKVDEALAILVPLADGKPELRFEIARLWIQKTLRQPVNQRNWAVVEKRLSEAEKARPEDKEVATLLRVDMLTGKSQMAEARSLLGTAQAREPKNLKYRLVLARLADVEKKGIEALEILDQAEKDLGPSLDITLARLDHWVQQGGAKAKAAVAKLAETRRRLPAADQPRFLDRLAMAEIRLGQPALARQHLRELSAIQPDNIQVLMGRFDLALAANDEAEASEMVENIRKAEGEQGTNWRFVQASYLIDRARRGDSTTLETAHSLASEIASRRADWWAAPLLDAQIAELRHRPDEALAGFLRAVELGNGQPPVIRRLTGLLYQRNQFDEIDRVTQLLRERGIAPEELTIVNAINAIRKQDFDQGIALARQVFPETSTNPSDHLTLGRFYVSAGRSDAAGKEFRRAVELGPGVPDSWLTYVQYLVQAKQIDQAKTAIEGARQALPADRATLTLAQCWMSLGDLKRAEDLIGKAFNDEGKSADPAALRLATIVSLGQNRLDKVDAYLNKLDRVADLSPGDKAWVNRIRVALLLNKGRPAGQDQALGLVEQNLKNDPNSIEDQRLKATVLALRPSRRDEAAKILEQLGAANLLDAKERFLLARLYLGQPNEEKCQSEMVKLLNLKVRNPQHLAHFFNYWIGHDQLDQADRWLAELKKAEPQGVAALELEARLLDLRKRKPQLLALLEARGREVPDQVGLMADLLNRYGFAKEAETAYKAFIAREPRQPERVLALAQFLARQDRVAEAMGILKKAWSTCRPEQVAAAALLVFDAPSAGDVEKRQVEAWVAEAVRKRRPDAVRLKTRLGAIWLWQGRFDEAEGLYRRMLESSPDDPEALNNLAWLLALRDQTKTEEALQLVNHAIDVQGRTAALIDTKAVVLIPIPFVEGEKDRIRRHIGRDSESRYSNWAAFHFANSFDERYCTKAVVLIRSNQPGQAIEVLKDAQSLDKRNASVALHLAWAYQSGGKTDEARKAFREAEKLGWKLAGSDPLERPFMEKLRSELGQ